MKSSLITSPVRVRFIKNNEGRLLGAYGLSAYSYPVQDLRLLIIFGCSMVFGLCLSAHVIWSLRIKHKIRLFLITLAITTSFILFSKGFDIKSAFALLVPAVISLVLAAIHLRRRDPRALAFVFSLGLFLLCLVLSPFDFLNVTFFYWVALLLVILFINEIQAYSKERKARLKDQANAEKLQETLEKNWAKDGLNTISVGSAGKLEVINTAEIVYCKGAGDYAELSLKDGRSMLHSQRLTELEKTLPSIFLRVHRSFIVNSALINSLTRKPSGVGELSMAGGQLVPVSRRIMPSVRDKLA